jgi:hypothetical protein
LALQLDFLQYDGYIFFQAFCLLLFDCFFPDNFNAMGDDWVVNFFLLGEFEGLFDFEYGCFSFPRAGVGFLLLFFYDGCDMVIFLFTNIRLFWLGINYIQQPWVIIRNPLINKLIELFIRLQKLLILHNITHNIIYNKENTFLHKNLLLFDWNKILSRIIDLNYLFQVLLKLLNNFLVVVFYRLLLGIYPFELCCHVLLS